MQGAGARGRGPAVMRGRGPRLVPQPALISGPSKAESLANTPKGSEHVATRPLGISTEIQCRGAESVIPQPRGQREGEGAQPEIGNIYLRHDG